ncbi:hypothetical protein [Rudanella lutea]|uniref:hypothetical protein n=1 Tax=Rudanella lutea TaxID=451374 RepID=UPI00036635B6|nr:hypothetical protein [Rudanella lutea]
MEKPINNKIDTLRNEAETQEELMKSLAQIDEEGQLTDDVLDAVSGGDLSRGDLKAIIGIEPIGIMPIGMMPEPDVMPLPGTISL